MAKHKPGDIDAMIARAAQTAGVPVPLFRSLIKNGERSWKGWQTSPAGAQGPSQLMPGTAHGLAQRYHIDPTDYYGNLLGGAYYLKEQLDHFKNPSLAVAAYNAGPGAVSSHGGVPNYPETQAYVKNVMRGVSKEMGDPLPRSRPPVPEMAPMGGIGGSPVTDPMSFSAPSDTTVSILRRLGGSAASVTQRAQEPIPTPQPQQAQQQPGQVEIPNTRPELPVKGEPTVNGLNAEFARRLQSLMHAIKAHGGSLSISSGARDASLQAKLYQQALAKYGSESAARKWVAPPGKSNHDSHAGIKYGLGDGALASDLRGDLQLAHQLAPKFGLVFPLGNEAWHIELAGIRQMKGT